MVQPRREDVESALHAIVARFGSGVGREPDRLRALLHDMLGDAARPLRNEILAVVAAASAVGAGSSGPAAGELPAWAAETWRGALAYDQTALPGTAQAGSGTATTEAPAGPPSERGQDAGAPRPLPPAPPEGVSETVRTPGRTGGGASQVPASDPPPRVPRVLLAAGAAVVLLAGVSGALLLPGDAADGTDGASDDQVVASGSSPTPAAGSSPGPSASPTPSAAATSCPATTTDGVRAVFDIRRGLDLDGTVGTAQQHRALVSSAKGTGLAVRVSDFVTVGAAGASPDAVRTLTRLVPSMIETLSDGEAVATGEQVCLTGAYIDDVAHGQLRRATDKLASEGAAVTALLEPHPVDNHQAHAEILQSVITQELANKKIPFATGRAELLPAAAPVLDSLADILNVRFPEKRYPGLLVTVEGHTDDVGSRQANLALSRARAESVKRALVARGVPAGRLDAVGHGPDQPLTTNATEAGRQTNRRVVFNVGKDHGGAVGAGEHDGH